MFLIKSVTITVLASWYPAASYRSHFCSPPLPNLAIETKYSHFLPTCIWGNYMDREPGGGGNMYNCVVCTYKLPWEFHYSEIEMACNHLSGTSLRLEIHVTVNRSLQWHPQRTTFSDTCSQWTKLETFLYHGSNLGFFPCTFGFKLLRNLEIKRWEKDSA